MTGSAITSIQVAGLFISPGHNFIGHHGRPPGEHPIVAVNRVECVAGRGVRGDRFFDHQPDFKGQVTFVAVETFEALARELGLNDARPELTRRNVLTRGRPEDGRDRGSGQPHAQGILTDEEYAAANAKALALQRGGVAHSPRSCPNGWPKRSGCGAAYPIRARREERRCRRGSWESRSAVPPI